MTLTKYQKGEAMEGWNDCPPDVMMLHSDTSSSSLSSTRSSSSSTRRKAKRVSMTFGGSNPSLQTNQPGAANGLFTSINALPLGPPPKSRVNPLPLSLVRKERDHNEVQGFLNAVTESPLSLSKEEIDDCKSKITSQMELLNADKLMVLGDFLERTVLAQKTHDAVALTQIKTDIVKYMMANDGVSAWCTPLKRIVSSI